MLKTIALAPLALGLAATSPIAAQSTEVAIPVPYADLNLSNEEGRRALDRRLANAAKAVCGGRPNIRDLKRMTAFRACVKATRKSYEAERLAAVEAANVKRVAVLADKLGFLALR